MATSAETPLLLCYDGSGPAKHAIERAADLLPTRNAVVPDRLADDRRPWQLRLGGRDRE
jgi:hypothetical protein